MTGVGLPERARSFPGEERASPLRQVPVPPAYRNASVDQGRSLWSFSGGAVELLRDKSTVPTRTWGCQAPSWRCSQKLDI